MSEARRPLRTGEFITPAAAEHKLRICNHELITRALDFTKDRLGARPRKHPYPTHKSLYDHSVEVGAIVQSMFPIDTDPFTSDQVQNDWHAKIIATAVLHDVVEDSGVEYEELEREFGADVALGVSMLSEIKGIPFLQRKQKYVEQFEDATTPDHIVAISLADKYINVRDMNKAYATLLKQYSDPRLAKAIYYGEFWTPPTEAVQFYHYHSTVMHNRLDPDPRYSTLLRRYDDARNSWQQSFMPPDQYSETIVPEPSTKIREIALTGVKAINARLETLQTPMRVIVGGSTAYGLAVRQDTSNGATRPTLNNIDLILYTANHAGTLEEHDANFARFFADDTIRQYVEALKQMVVDYCGQHGIELPNIDTMIKFH